MQTGKPTDASSCEAENPAALVVAVGCYVQTGREDVEQDPCIDLAIGNNRKKDLASILEEYLRDLEQEDAVAENAEIPDMVWTRLCMTLLS